MSSAQDCEIVGPGGLYEQLPNRDSLPYKKSYGLEDAHTVYRGTLRYRGFSQAMATMADVGLFSEDTFEGSWRDYLAEKMQSDDPEDALREKLDWMGMGAQSKQSMDAFRYLGLFSDEQIEKSVIDSLCDKMTERLAYRDGERDMCLLHHEFGVVNADGTRKKLTSTLDIKGEPYFDGPSSMATTVGVTAAVAARCVLDGTIARRGVFIPVHKDVYEPILEEMENEGVCFVEREKML